MKYCSRCLYPENHPLGITFDNDGVCSGCREHEEKEKINWTERFEELKDLCNRYKSPHSSSPNCIVPVSGGKDSLFIAHTVKHVLGMHPLLVNYNRHYNTKIGIRNLAYLRTLVGCDIITSTVSPQTTKKITKETLRLLGDIYWHCNAGTTAFAVQTATRFKIPLIIWGAHEGCEKTGMVSIADRVEMSREYRKKFELGGVEAEDLVNLSSELTLADLEPYVYPDQDEIDAIGVRGVYLSNYIRWDSKKQHEDMIAKYGYECSPQQRTFDTYNDVDCFHYAGLNDWIQFQKFGYGLVTEHASREIRRGRLTKEQGQELETYYLSVQPKDAVIFLKWLGITQKELESYIEPHRDPNVWEYIDEHWNRKAAINDVNESNTEQPPILPSSCQFSLPIPRTLSVEDSYLLMGRGFVDTQD